MDQFYCTLRVMGLSLKLALDLRFLENPSELLILFPSIRNFL